MAIFKFCIVCLVFTLVGCGKTAEQTTTDNKIQETEGLDTTATGERTGGGGTTSLGDAEEIPKGFPADVYIYRPSRIMTAMDMPDGGLLALATSDDVATVAEAYKREMTARSWSEQSALKNGERLMLVYEKEGSITNITIGSMGGDAQIMVTVSKN